MNNLDVILQKRNEYNQGTRVINCVVHASINLTNRPDTCKLCIQDIKNQLSLAIRVNTFLNELLDEIETNAR